MKKTILASAILLAGAANAAEIYNNEGTSVTLGGSFRGHVVIQDSDDVKFEDAGSRFNLKASKELDNGLTAFGAAEIKNSDVPGGKDKGLYLNKVYVGLAHDVYGTVELGQQYGLNDDAFKYDFSYEHGNIYNEDNETLGSDSEDQLKYTKEFGGASVVVSLMDQDTYAIGGTYDVAGLSLVASYNVANDRPTNVNTKFADNSTYVVGASYALDALTLGAVYTAAEVDSVDMSAFGLGAHYALGQASVYAMFDSTSHDDKEAEYTEIVIGADYELADGVIAFAEFGSKDAESAKNSEEVLFLGGRVYF